MESRGRRRLREFGTVTKFITLPGSAGSDCSHGDWFASFRDNASGGSSHPSSDCLFPRRRRFDRPRRFSQTWIFRSPSTARWSRVANRCRSGSPWVAVFGLGLGIVEWERMGLDFITYTSGSRHYHLSHLASKRRAGSADRPNPRHHDHILPTHSSRTDFLRRV